MTEGDLSTSASHNFLAFPRKPKEKLESCGWLPLIDPEKGTGKMSIE